MSEHRFLGWSPMTDTCELPIVWPGGPPTMAMHPVFDLPPSPQEAPAPPPVRLPRRLRRRVASHVALLVTSAFGFTAALTAGGAW